MELLSGSAAAWRDENLCSLVVLDASVSGQQIAKTATTAWAYASDMHAIVKWAPTSQNQARTARFVVRTVFLADGARRTWVQAAKPSASPQLNKSNGCLPQHCVGLLRRPSCNACACLSFWDRAVACKCRAALLLRCTSRIRSFNKRSIICVGEKKKGVAAFRVGSSLKKYYTLCTRRSLSTNRF